MDLIDDSGRVFGLVNIIDLLVVLLVVAVGVAGAALVLSEDPAPEPTPTTATHATIDFGTQPPNVAQAINEGDSYSPSEHATITLTDVYAAPEGGQSRIVAKAKLTGEADDGSLSYDGAPPRLNRKVSLQTDRYSIDGRIQSVGEADALPQTSTQVLLRSTVPANLATDLVAGDELTSAGRTVGTVESVTTYETGNPDRKTAYVGVALDTLAMHQRQYFGTAPVREGNALTVRTADHEFGARIQRVGALTQRGTETTRTVVLRKTDVYAPMAEAISPGMSDGGGETAQATITDVDVEPSVVLIRGEDGDLGVYDHPTKRDVTITATLRVRETANGIRYKGDPIQQGSTVDLDLGTATVRGTVVTIR